MILLESKDLSLLLFILSFPHFLAMEEFDSCFLRELPGELILAGQLETSPGRGDSWIVLSEWLSMFSSSLMPQVISLAKDCLGHG